jgi:hypothetical protein
MQKRLTALGYVVASAPVSSARSQMRRRDEAWGLWALDVADAVLERHSDPRKREGS